MNQSGTSYLTLRGGGTAPLRRIEMASGKETKSANYVHGVNGICTVHDSEMGDFSCLNDYQGALRLTFDTNGQKKGEITYDAWGMPKVLQGDAIHPFYRNDHEYVEDFQIFVAGARLYDPHLKRFLEPDPKMLNHSPYTAFNNNPILFRDHSGLQPGMSIILFNMDEGEFFADRFEIMWRDVLHIPVRFKALPILENFRPWKKAFQSNDDLLGSAGAFSVEQPAVPLIKRGFSGHIMVALEHGAENSLGEFEKTTSVLRGMYAYGKPQIARDVYLGEFEEEPSFFEEPLGKTVMDCIERGYPVKTISILKCGANPAQMIRATRRAILSEAENRGVSLEMMEKVKSIVGKIRLNVVDSSCSIGENVSKSSFRNKAGKVALSDDDYLYTRKVSETLTEKLTSREAKRFLRRGDLPAKGKFAMKAYSIAEDIPEGLGEDAERMAVIAAEIVFLLKIDVLKDEWKEFFKEREFLVEEQMLLEKIKERVMKRLEWTQNVEIKESHRNFLLANKGYEILVHPLFLTVLNQWIGTAKEKEKVLSLFIENELRQMQAKEGKQILTESDVNDLEFDSWVKVLQGCNDEENELLQDFMDFAFSSETEDRQLFDEAFKDMREKGFHVAFDKGEKSFQERVSTDDISKRLIAVGVLRQRMFSSPQPHFSTSV